MRITIFQNQSISKQLTTFYLVLSLEVYKVYFCPSLIFGPHVSFSECYSITFYLKIEYKEICTINTYNSNHHAVSFSFHCASNDHSLVLFFLFSPNKYFYVMAKQPSGQDAGFPIHGSNVQNHWVATKSTRPFFLPRSIK